MHPIAHGRSNKTLAAIAVSVCLSSAVHTQEFPTYRADPTPKSLESCKSSDDSSECEDVKARLIELQNFKERWPEIPAELRQRCLRWQTTQSRKCRVQPTFLGLQECIDRDGDMSEFDKCPK